MASKWEELRTCHHSSDSTHHATERGGLRRSLVVVLMAEKSHVDWIEFQLWRHTLMSNDHLMEEKTDIKRGQHRRDRWDEDSQFGGEGEHPHTTSRATSTQALGESQSPAPLPTSGPVADDHPHLSAWTPVELMSTIILHWRRSPIDLNLLCWCLVQSKACCQSLPASDWRSFSERYLVKVLVWNGCFVRRCRWLENCSGGPQTAAHYEVLWHIWLGCSGGSSSSGGAGRDRGSRVPWVQKTRRWCWICAWGSGTGSLLCHLRSVWRGSHGCCLGLESHLRSGMGAEKEDVGNI